MFFEKVFRRLFIWYAEILTPMQQKKSVNISFFMEEDMVCEKQKLAGMTA